MDKDELARQLESIAGTVQYQVLNNLDDLIAPVVKEGRVSKEELEKMVKRPLMQVVTKLRSIRVTTQNPGLERTTKENVQ
jgi:predicted transcriptional regulator